MIAARGGYGISRILPAIDWARVGESRKAFIGFSDFTAFNCAALSLAGLATFHGPMVAMDFGDGEPDPFMRAHFEATLWGARDSHTATCDHAASPATISGTLWGGNLAMLAHLAGTPYLPLVEGGLLYVEELDEQPYAVERLFLQLHHAGVLARQSAILLGDFARCRAHESAALSLLDGRRWRKRSAASPAARCSRGCPSATSPASSRSRSGCQAVLSLGKDEYTPRLAGTRGHLSIPQAATLAQIAESRAAGSRNRARSAACRFATSARLRAFTGPNPRMCSGSEARSMATAMFSVESRSTISSRSAS